MIQTLHFGELEVNEDEIFLFSNGLPGFEECERFVLLPAEEESPFSYLQSLDNPNISFVVTNPFLFFTDYEFDLTESAREDLEIDSEEDVLVISIVTVNHSANEASVNLLAPIVLNVSKRKGRQVILHDTSYRTKHILVTQEEQHQGIGGDASC